MSQIEIINISKSFGGERVLDSFSQTLPDSGAVVLMGPSGAGKTTLLRVLAGLIPADSGEIRGMENKRVSVVFQEDRLLPWLTARENIEVVGKSGEINGEEWLSRFGMEAAAGKYPAELSGGMRRRVGIARALAYGGDVFLLDEPFRELDAETKEAAMNVVAGETKGKLVVLVTHDTAEAEFFGGRIISI